MTKDYELIGGDVLVTKRLSGYDNIPDETTAFRLSSVVRWEPIGFKNDQTRIWLRGDQQPVNVPILFDEFTKIIGMPVVSSPEDFDLV